MSFTIVQSIRNPELERISDPEWENWFEDEKEKKAAKQSAILIKRRVSSGDQRRITDATYDAILRARQDNPLLQDLETTVQLGTGIIITAAVMVDSFEGPLFADDDTGRTLAMGGSMDDRLEIIERLPLEVVQFIDREVGRLNNGPLRFPSTEKGSKKGSGRASTPDSSPETTD